MERNGAFESPDTAGSRAAVSPLKERVDRTRRDVGLSGRDIGSAVSDILGAAERAADEIRTQAATKRDDVCAKLESISFALATAKDAIANIVEDIRAAIDDMQEGEAPARAPVATGQSFSSVPRREEVPVHAPAASAPAVAERAHQVVDRPPVAEHRPTPAVEPKPAPVFTPRTAGWN